MKTIFIDSDTTLEMGYCKITLDKLFGSLIFCDLRVWPDSKTCEWVVERQRIDEAGDSSWEEITRIDGQDSIHFPDVQIDGFPEEVNV